MGAAGHGRIEKFARRRQRLMLNREDLDILVHPLSDDSMADHTRLALWLGSALPLRVDVLRRGPRPG